MSREEYNLIYFISFCIEIYKTECGIPGREALRIFDEYGVTEYLAENYEPLHTQSHQWLIKDISDFIKLRKEAHDA